MVSFFQTVDLSFLFTIFWVNDGQRVCSSCNSGHTTDVRDL